MHRIKWLRVSILRELIFLVSCGYYYNGTHPIQSPVLNLLWFNNSMVTYVSSEFTYLTESLYNQSDLPLYYSSTEPNSQNVFFYFTSHLAKEQAKADSYHMAFFTRDNQPQCQADITHNFGQAQNILLTTQSVYVLQKALKIHLNKVSSPNHSLEKAIKCKQVQYNSTTVENFSFDNKKMTFLYQSKEIAISYQNHIVILSQQNNELTVVQTIKLPETLNTSRYEIRYVWTEEKEQILVGRQSQLLVYVRGDHENEYGLGFTVKLAKIFMSMEVIDAESVLVLTNDCKVNRISLTDSKIPPDQIASFSDKCNSSEVTPLLGVRKNSDLIFITLKKLDLAQTKQQFYSQNQKTTSSQLQIYVQSLSDSSKTQLVYQIPMQYKEKSFQLHDLKFIQETDFLYLVINDQGTSRKGKNPVSQTLFMGFQIFSLKQQSSNGFEWQWRSRAFIDEQIQDYSISDDGIAVLESKNGQQNLTWYKTVVSYVDWPYPIELVSRISPVTVLEIFPNSLSRAFNFQKWEGLYSIYPPKKPHSISPNGQYVACILDDNKTLQIMTSEITGMIGLKNYSLNSSLVSFMNNNTVIQLNQKQNNTVELLAYEFEFKSKTEFTFTISDPFVIDGVAINDIVWNLENVLFLSEKKDQITVLNLDNNQFIKDEEVILERNITKNGLKMKSSIGKTIDVYSPGEKMLHQYIWCQSNEYLRDGQCAERSIGPDPNPFPWVQIILAVSGIMAIFITVYFAIKWHRSRSRLYRLENSLIESTRDHHHNNLDIDQE